MKKIILAILAIATLASCSQTKSITNETTAFNYKKAVTSTSPTDGFGFERNTIDTNRGTAIIYKKTLKIKNRKYKILKESATEIYACSFNTTIHLLK